MRKLLRQIARHNMTRAGWEQINKPYRTDKGKTTKFAQNWRKFL